MGDKKNIPGPGGIVERRSGNDRRRKPERRGPLRWDPRNEDRRKRQRRRPEK